MTTFAATGMAVADLERSTAFYVAVFGMTKQQTYDLDHMTEHILGFEGRRGPGLVLMEYKGKAKPAHDTEATKFVFYVDDVATVATSIRDAGGRITYEPAAVPGFGGATIGFAVDLDGYLLELVQLPATS